MKLGRWIIPITAIFILMLVVGCGRVKDNPQSPKGSVAISNQEKDSQGTLITDAAKAYGCMKGDSQVTN